MVWIKICGITNIYDAKKISDLGADALGFILSTDSPRRISEEKSDNIIMGLRKYCLSINRNMPLLVGVFVNEKIDRIFKFIDKKIFDFIQLSGKEAPDYIGAIRNYDSDIRIIKLIRISEYSKPDSIYKKISSFTGSTDFFLIDTFKKGIYGGTGRSFNWNSVKNLGESFPIILAGGLEACNVRKAIDIIKPFGVDASSRLEEYAGKKDIKKTGDFINAVRSV